MESNVNTLAGHGNLTDDFFLEVTPDGKHIATGGYMKSGHVIDINGTSNSTVTCVFD